MSDLLQEEGVQQYFRFITGRTCTPISLIQYRKKVYTNKSDSIHEESVH